MCSVALRIEGCPFTKATLQTRLKICSCTQPCLNLKKMKQLNYRNNPTVKLFFAENWYSKKHNKYAFSSLQLRLLSFFAALRLETAIKSITGNWICMRYSKENITWLVFGGWAYYFPRYSVLDVDKLVSSISLREFVNFQYWGILLVHLQTIPFNDVNPNDWARLMRAVCIFGLALRYYLISWLYSIYSI